MSLLQVAIGGATGAMLRYLVNISSSTLLGTGFPYGTLFVNVIGSLLMGMLVAYFSLNPQHSERFAPLIVNGFLGGFTTFSAFSHDSWQLFNNAKMEWALLYILGSIILSLGALILGVLLTKSLIQ